MSARHTTKLQALLVDEHFKGEVFPFEPMTRHTFYRIGGPARFFVQVASVGALSSLITACNEEDIAWIVLGKGSNVLVSDEGFDGVVITLGDDFRRCHFDEECSCFVVGAGTSLASVVQHAFKRGLAGLEFCVGTPGTVGGALRMNAGSSEEWIGSHVISATVYKAGIGLKKYWGNEIAWDYRSSSFALDEVIIECEIAVESTFSAHIREKMEALLLKRKKSQPMNKPSCGSVFKNPAGQSAGALIEGAGLKGRAIGGAMISDQHANFIINTGEARAEEVKKLIELAQIKVKEKYGIELQPEVKYLGFSKE